MGRVLPGRFCFAACCCALALLLTLASRDASQAQQRYQARIDLKLEIRIKEAWWEGRSAVPTRVIPFCVRNVGTMSSGAATLRVDRILVGGFTVAEFAIHPLAPNEEKCDRVRITARPDWHGTTQYFAGDLKVNDDADLSSNYVRFPVAFPSDQKVDLDLRVGSPHLDPGGLLIVPFVVTNYGTATSRTTRVAFWLEAGEFLGAHPVDPLAPNATFTRGMRVKAPASEGWFTTWYVAVVDPDHNVGDINRSNNLARFSFPIAPPAGPGGRTESPEDGLWPIILIGVLIALGVWGVRKWSRAAQEAPQPPAGFRAVPHLDAGTQTIQLESDDVVLPDLRLRPVPNAGVQWIEFENAKPGR